MHVLEVLREKRTWRVKEERCSSVVTTGGVRHEGEKIDGSKWSENSVSML